jgi:hypothetical protein
VGDSNDIAANESRKNRPTTVSVVATDAVKSTSNRFRHPDLNP